MGFFANLLKDIGITRGDYCSGDCEEACDGYGQDIEVCAGNCVNLCYETSKSNEDLFICIFCGDSCEGTCKFECGKNSCKGSCDSQSKGK